MKPIFETEHALIINHPVPSYPLHLLILPKAGWRNFAEVDGTAPFWAALPEMVKELAVNNHLDAEGYRLIINSGVYQGIEMLHVHFVSGENQHDDSTA